MEENQVVIKNRASKDVDKLIISKRKKLKKAKKRINEKDIPVPKTGFQKAISIVVDILIIPLFLVCALLCTANIYSRMRNRSCTMFGYTFMRIASGSMRASGFEIGDTISIRAVDTDTLKPGDMIAFYVNTITYKNLNRNELTRLNTFSEEHTYLNSFSNFFGANNPDIDNAAIKNCKVVFHHIERIYEDEDGTRWFITKGSSNVITDIWYLKESMIIGIYDASKTASFMTMMITSLTTIEGVIVCLVIPLTIFCLVQIYELLIYVRLAYIENEIITGKRSLKDLICIKYNLGYSLDERDKYRVLLSAPDEDMSEFCTLLWKDYETVMKTKKYVIRKTMLTTYYNQLNELKDTTNQMYKDGVPYPEIVEFYETRLNQIEEDLENAKHKLKTIHKNAEREKAFKKIGEENSGDSKKQKQTRLEKKQERIKKELEAEKQREQKLKLKKATSIAKKEAKQTEKKKHKEQIRLEHVAQKALKELNEHTNDKNNEANPK